MNVFAIIGRVVLATLAEIGALTRFIWLAVSHVFRPPFFWRLIAQQMLRIGYFSLPVVALTAFFTGGALALQIYYGGNSFNSESIVATIVALGITRELGPVLGGLMVAGRVSAAIAAELGTMRVTEQIDALTTLSTNPYRFLVAPRVTAATLAMPVLVIIADIIGVMGGYLVSVNSLGFNGAIYLQKTLDFVTADDIIIGLTKAAVFGFIISIMGCFFGFNSRGGAGGVGRAATYAVVAAAVLILASNYMLTTLFVK